MSDTKQYMVVITDGRERAKSCYGYTWEPVGEWTEAKDWNPEPVMKGGLLGQHPEAGGFGYPFTGTVPELVEIEGPITMLQFEDLNRQVYQGGIKVRRAKRIAVGNLDVPEMPRRWWSLNFSGCTGRIVLPAGLTVTWFYMPNCTGLRELPVELTSSEIDVSYCSNLRRIGKGLLAGQLLAVGCTRLREISAGLSVDTIDVSGCTSLREMPNDLKARRIVGLENTGIPA